MVAGGGGGIVTPEGDIVIEELGGEGGELRHVGQGKAQGLAEDVAGVGAVESELVK